MIPALVTPRAGEWKHSTVGLRDVPIGRCEGHGGLVYEGWSFHEELPGGKIVVRVVLCDDCTKEAVK